MIDCTVDSNAGLLQIGFVADFLLHSYFIALHKITILWTI